MKLLGSLAILSFAVISTAVEINNNEENEYGEYCSDKCKDVCGQCEVQQLCNLEHETKCGMKDPDPNFHEICKQHEICVPTDHNCPCYDEDGKAYPLTTIVECGDDEILCSGITPGNGCPGQDFCTKRGVDYYGGLCDGFCPISCDDEQIKCDQPADPVSGCAQAPKCISKMKDTYGEFCPTQQCPVMCLEIEFFCEGPQILLGCKDKDICVTRKTQKNGDPCPGICPVKCDPEKEIKCDGQMEPTACITQEECHAKAKDVNGEYCPDNSDSHGCTKICPEDEILCPAKMNPLGCKEEAKCYPVEKDEHGNKCPDSSVCPSICQPGEVSCPAGTDENGCQKPEVCVKQERDYDGDLCPAHCPAICADNQILCEGHVDEKGCQTPDICAPKGLKTRGNDIGSVCFGICPGICKHNEILCCSQVDCDGCMTEEVCRPKAKDKNGLFCPDDSDSHGCAIECDAEAGEVLCPTYEDAVGCKPKGQCVQRPMDTESPDRQFCPAHSVCKKQCQPGEMLCSDGTDLRGCKNADLCLPRGQDKNGILCPVLCPPICNDDEYSCPGLIQSNGCKGEATCVKRKADTNGLTCPEVCPIACSERELVVEGGINERQCLEPDTCKANEYFEFDKDYVGNDLNNCGAKTPSAQECQEMCNKDDSCNAFTWVGIALDDDDNNINKCCLKALDFNKQTSIGLVSGPKQNDAKKVCVKMTTGKEEFHDGRVQATMNGVITVDDFFQDGVVALDSCFKGLKNIKLHNPTNNGWAGTIEITDDGKPTSISCEACSGSKALTDGDIVVDGNDDSSKLSDTLCQNGDSCLLTWEILE